ncbi:sigma factor-like helix-turn-helix DNA-binding protein [Streptomyces vinaceus]|uniref:sigma factor-like helix-turn-helix DNA-binding protein n=1 Tax=Streptomyces vinaceus TaxID=1960 RepID=UPI0036A1CE84
MKLVVMLRHFSGITTYQEIAAACEVPVGTVRCRIRQARAKMAQVLMSTDEQAHDDARALAARSTQEAAATPRAWDSGGLPREIREISELWPAHSQMVGRLGRPGGHVHPVPVMRSHLEDGVRQHLRHVVAGRDIEIWEMDVTHDGAPGTSVRPASPGSSSASTGAYNGFGWSSPGRPNPEGCCRTSVAGRPGWCSTCSITR